MTTRRPRTVLLAGTVVLASLTAGACRDGSSNRSPTAVAPTTAEPAGGTPACAEPSLPTTVAYRDLPDVDPGLVSLDVHAPAGACGLPVWVWVHGGGYRTGDKSNRMADKVRLAREQGWILVSVNYRLTDPDDPTSARFPDHFDDVAAAVAWVHDTITRYGGDPDRIALFGHSAGADIVSNVATVPTYLQAHGLDLDALSCAGPLDTEGFDKAGAGAADPDGERDQWQAALGNNPDYVAATSATLQVRPGIGIPPMIGVVRGTARRRQIEAAFLDTVRSTGVGAVAIDARTLTHGQVTSRIGQPEDTVMTAPVVAFLRDCFA